MVKVSMYSNTDPAYIAQEESWLGASLDAVGIHGGYGNWTDWLTSPQSAMLRLAGTGKDILWALPLIPVGATLADAASGAYDDKYLAQAKQMVAGSQKDGDIYIRLGWEFNGTGWFPWSAVGQPQNYIAAFQRVVDIFRSVSSKFRFEWTPNIGSVGMNPEDAYPGDDYVDVIGMDFYWNAQKSWSITDPTKAWNYYVTTKWGLQWQQSFAAAHNKPTAIGEWGVNSNNGATFIKLADKWFEAHHLLYHNYWNSNGNFAGKLTDGQYPDAGAAFKAAFAGDTGSGEVIAPMAYGAGDDSYGVVGPTDIVIELANAGYDTVNAAISYTLPANVEKLVLTGSAHLNGTGNAAPNLLMGNVGNNLLLGLDGNDSLSGDAGADTLDGGAGADTMAGGGGNDSYVVDDIGDVVAETDPSTAGGYDSVSSSVSYALSANVEELDLTGAAAINGAGNMLANLIVGNTAANQLNGLEGDDTLNALDGNDTIDGGAGADAMTGGAGDDRFIVDNAGDTVIELGGGGVDTIAASVTFALSAFVETLELTGTANIDGTGNALANMISGNSSDNKLDGGAGIDQLSGGLGNDIFLFKAGEANGDTVTDFTGNGAAIGDSIVLQGYGPGAIFTIAAGKLSIVYSGGIDIINIDTTKLSVSDITMAGAPDDSGIWDIVSSGVSYTLSAYAEELDLIGTAPVNGTGNALANLIVGNAAPNQLDGMAGKDTLNGGAGIDTLVGGAGDDRFIIDTNKDVIVELDGGGIDTVMSGVSYTLAAFVENLQMTGSAGIGAYGNLLDNLITGNGGNNEINGYAGNDTISGGGGVDTLNGGAGNDLIDGGAGADKLSGATGNDVFLFKAGEANGDTITDFIGNGTSAGDSILFQGYGPGASFAITAGKLSITDGGLTEIINIDTTKLDASDISGALNDPGGYDIVSSAVSYTLATFEEELDLIGTAPVNGTGNALANLIVGNAAPNQLDGMAGNDTLNGGAGIDTLVGGAGDDRFIIDTNKDVIVELDGGGIDTVMSGVSYTLAAFVENLQMTGSAGIGAYGNLLDNLITGNGGNNEINGYAGNDTISGGGGVDTLNGLAGNDLIDGGAGADKLSGGTGNDVFLFKAGEANGDTITDFVGNGTAAGDSILFQGYGPGASFVVGAGTLAISYGGGIETIALDTTKLDPSDILFA